MLREWFRTRWTVRWAHADDVPGVDAVGDPTGDDASDPSRVD